MRPSSRDSILDAAVRVIERGGVTALTYDSVSVETGLTKGGLLYHFPSRDALLEALLRHITDRWENQLLAVLGKPAAEASPAERLAAYAAVTAENGVGRADLAFVVESATDVGLGSSWIELQQRWVPIPDSLTQDFDDADIDDADIDLAIAQLAADGLWFLDVTRSDALSLRLRRLLADRISALGRGRD